jgi:hypothetical protein
MGMTGDFWKQIDEDEKREQEQQDEAWKFKIESYKDLSKQTGWLLFIKDVDEWLDALEVQIEAMGFDGEPSMWNMGYHQATRSTLMRVKNHVKRTLEEEESG